MSFVVCVFVSKCSDNRLIVSDVMSRKKKSNLLAELLKREDLAALFVISAAR